MTKHLRSFLVALMLPLALGMFAQKPASGTYKIKNASTGKYITIQGRYYAKPDGTTGDDITVGVGIANYDFDGTTATPDGSYRLYSLGGSYNGTNIEIFDYLDKAVTLAKNIGSQKISQVINKYIENNLKSKYGDAWASKTDAEKEAAIAAAMNSNFWNSTTYAEIVDMLDELAKEVIDAYKVDYGFVSVIPSADGTQLKVAVPTIPVSVDKACQAFTGKDAWTWACAKIVSTLEERGSDATLQALVKNNLEKIAPGKTYYLTADSDGTFGFTESATDATSYWTMELQTEATDKLVSGLYMIQNTGTSKFVEVLEKYYAKPDVEVTDPEAVSFDDIAKLGMNLEIGRIDRNDENLYQITDISSNGASIAAYTAKTISLAKTTVLNTMDSKQSTMTSIIDKINSMLGTDVTYAEARQDVSDFVDTYAEAYGNLKLEAQSGDNETKLYVQIPTIPDFLHFFYQWYKKDASANLLDWIKSQVRNYLANSGTNETLKKLVLNNLDNVQEGAKYYLTADNDDTFGYYDATAGGSNDVWKLVVPSVKQYVRIMNAEDNSYVNITGKTEISSVASGSQLTEPGTVIYVEGPINALTSVRSQGVDAITYVNALNQKTNLNFSIGLTPAGEVNGEQAFYATTTIPNSSNWASIKEVIGNVTLPEAFAFFESLKTVMATANAGETIYMNGGSQATKDIAAATMWLIKPIVADEDGENFVADNPVTFNGKNYVTRCLDFAVTLPEGAKAYTGSINDKKNEVVLNEISGTIPAGTPFILETTTESAILTPVIDNTTAITSGLTSTASFFGEATESGKKYYSLTTANGKGGFYLVPASVTKLPGNRAFIVMDSSAAAKAWTVVFEETTGITDVETTESKDATIYDLQGRRVNTLAKGIYIVNGKKYVK